MKTTILLLSVLLLGSCTFIVDPAYDHRNQVTGSYQVQEYSETYNSTLNYNVTISKSGYGNDVSIRNFYNDGLTVYAQFGYDNKIYIPWQSREGYEIEGVGTLYGSGISMSYRVRDTYNQYRTDFCKTEMWKQW